jgi:hypothetical protein
MHSVITGIFCNHCNTSITAFNPHPAIRRHKNISLAKLFSLMDTLSCTEASMFQSKSTPPFLFSLAQTYTPKLIVVLAHMNEQLVEMVQSVGIVEKNELRR